MDFNGWDGVEPSHLFNSVYPYSSRRDAANEPKRITDCMGCKRGLVQPVAADPLPINRRSERIASE